MRVQNDALRKTFNAKKRCEYCSKGFPQGLDPHHVPTRGAGGSDFRCMLMAVCRECHSTRIDTPEGAAECLAIIATREGVTVEDLVAVHHALLRLPKGCSPWMVAYCCGELSDMQQVLMRRELNEAGVKS